MRKITFHGRFKYSFETDIELSEIARELEIASRRCSHDGAIEAWLPLKIFHMWEQNGEFHFAPSIRGSSSFAINTNVFVWVGPTNHQHGPRIKVSNILGRFAPNDNFVITLCEYPSVVAGECKLSTDKLNFIKNWVVRELPDLLLVIEAATQGSLTFEAAFENLKNKLTKDLK